MAMRTPYRVRRRFARWAAAAAALAACAGEPARTTPSSTSPEASAAPAAPRPSFGGAWARAKADADPTWLAALAEDEGAAGLVGALGDPVYGDVACRALPLARDADLGIAPLAGCARAGGELAHACADALLAVLARPGLDRERLDPEGERRAAADLFALAQDPRARREIRAAAVSALRRLGERGVAAPGDIPEELDHP
jgi:hypothetical protein